MKKIQKYQLKIQQKFFTSKIEKNIAALVPTDTHPVFVLCRLIHMVTEVVLFGTRQQPEKLTEDDTFEISEVIKPAPSAKKIYMEAQLKSQTHIAKVCITAYSNMKKI